jgi:hypothetical protein
MPKETEPTRGNLGQDITVGNITKGLSIERRKLGVGWRRIVSEMGREEGVISTFHRSFAISRNFT